MSEFTLIIGNKNVSSWSFRPWFAMTMAGIAFDEVIIPLGTAEFAATITGYSPSGKVPALRHGELVVWETLAILEYLAEVYPEKQLWPKDKAARAVARAVSHEMHAGFGNLRQHCPMNMKRQPDEKPVFTEAVLKDMQRIDAIWQMCRQTYGQHGPFLFGHVSNADAMFAPVVSRIESYGLPVSDIVKNYVNTITATSAFKKWQTQALQEAWSYP